MMDIKYTFELGLFIPAITAVVASLFYYFKGLNKNILTWITALFNIFKFRVDYTVLDNIGEDTKELLKKAINDGTCSVWANAFSIDIRRLRDANILFPIYKYVTDVNKIQADICKYCIRNQKVFDTIKGKLK